MDVGAVQRLAESLAALGDAVAAVHSAQRDDRDLNVDERSADRKSVV
jgi:hypothetical protein